ncbi:MAG: glycosyltransferase family 39 protein [Candidatus Chisholmbacteria bacterium]|nr:glycosyltransferase family 39 protein [Candidatus Chisholmbacteria bacterium]
MDKWKIAFWVVIALASFLSLYRLGSWALLDSDEATYARVLHESRQNNNFLTFTKLGRTWIDKPPLYFWLMGGTAAFLGETEFALRLPSALLIVATVFLVWHTALLFSQSKLTAFLSAAILTTSGFFMFAGRQARMDIPITFTLLLSFYCFIKGLKKPRWYIGFGTALALGILTKSIVGLLSLPLALLTSLVYKNWTWLKNKYFWLGLPLALLISAPWHIYQHLYYGPEFWQSYSFFVLNRIAVSFVADQPSVWYYFVRLLAEVEPWFILFFTISILFGVKSFSGKKPSPGHWLTLLSAFFFLVIFSLSKTRFMYYYVPALPFMALFLGLTLKELVTRFSFSTKLAILLPLIMIGLVDTSLHIFSPKERNFFFQSLPKITRYQVAEEEKIMGHYLAQNSLPLYAYRWNFYETLNYYGDAPHTIDSPQMPENPERPFLLLLPQPLVSSPKVQTALTEYQKTGAPQTIFSGNAALLLRYN